jgi:hypothetical protein
VTVNPEGRQMPQTQGSTRTQPPNEAHYTESSARENLIEHVFLGELLRGLWRKNVRDLEVLRPEVDSGGYDLALELMAYKGALMVNDDELYNSSALGGLRGRERGVPVDVNAFWQNEGVAAA